MKAALNLEDVDRDLPIDLRLRISDLVLMWAAYDSALTLWIAKAFGMHLDACSIMVGNMDSKSKLDKLFNLYEHHREVEGTAAIKALRKEHAIHVVVRNTVAHKRCVGVLRSSPDSMVFSSVKHIPGEVDQLEIVIMPLNDITESTGFAKYFESKVMLIADQLEKPIVERRRPSS